MKPYRRSCTAAAKGSSRTCDALVQPGHTVTLFASAGARTKASLVLIREQLIRLDPVPLESDIAVHLKTAAPSR